MAARLLTPLLLAACTVCGCAAGPDPRDPMEPFNRKVYSFNHAVDKAVLKPVAKGYVAVVPQLMRRGVTNFFNNLGVVVTTLNDALCYANRFLHILFSSLIGFLSVGVVVLDQHAFTGRKPPFASALNAYQS